MTAHAYAHAHESALNGGPAGPPARTLRLACSIVTSGSGPLRFEGFSSCGSTCARADLLPAAHEGQIVGKGTTNVDFNTSVRAQLAAAALCRQLLT